jgi:hypothetical protein
MIERRSRLRRVSARERRRQSYPGSCRRGIRADLGASQKLRTAASRRREVSATFDPPPRENPRKIAWPAGCTSVPAWMQLNSIDSSPALAIHG